MTGGGGGIRGGSNSGSSIKIHGAAGGGGLISVVPIVNKNRFRYTLHEPDAAPLNANPSMADGAASHDFRDGFFFVG